jgi:hypothetical protein
MAHIQRLNPNHIPLSYVLDDGEEVIVPIKVGEYEDNYPIFSAVVTIYNKNTETFLIKDCNDATFLIGKTFDKLGRIYRIFINELLKQGKIQPIFHINSLTRTVVKRNNKHISINRLIEQYKKQSQKK